MTLMYYKKMRTHYSVTLESTLVERAKKFAGIYGFKLSPVLNNLLKQWVNSQEKLEKVKLKGDKD